jgi:hypothetical protein
VAGGLRLTLLPGEASLDLLAHVTARRVVEGAGSTGLVLDARAGWAGAAITVTAYAAQPGLLRWTVALAVHGGGAPADADGTDLAYTNAGGTQAATPTVDLYTGAEPAATAQTFLYDGGLDSTAFYLADLTALGGFFAASGTAPVNGPFSDPRGGSSSLVGARAGGMGYAFPNGGLSGLVPGTPATTVMDSYLLLQPGQPGSEMAVAARFLDDLGAVYGMLERPALPPADWRRLGARTAHDLRGPDVVARLGGRDYLRAYVSDRRVAPELITQLNVLVGATEYARTFGDAGAVGQLRRMLAADLPTFYAAEYGTVVNNLPLPHGGGAASESWYYVGDLINLARLAQAGVATARALLLRSVGGAIALAHHVRYVFPRSIYYVGWRGGDGLQPDVAGAYAYLMEDLYGLTHHAAYLDEARAGLDHLAGYGFRLAYETHMTALAAAACAHLFALTGDRRYLALSLVPLANLFGSTWLWDCGYGLCARGAYHTYFGLSPQPWASYIAMMEQEEAYQALRDYALAAGDRAPTAVRTLVAEFCRYSLATLAYTLPPLLPKGVAGPAPGEYAFVPRNRLDLAIPLEDLREGSRPSGQIGQEIYGAGGPLALGGLSTARLAGDLWLTCAYPFAVTRTAGEWTLRLTGTPAYSVEVRLSGPGAARLGGVAWQGHAQAVVRLPELATFTAHGGETYALQFASGS